MSWNGFFAKSSVWKYDSRNVFAAPCACASVQHVLFHGRVAADGSSVPDERGDLVALHALDRRGDVRSGERGRDRDGVAQLVDFDHERDHFGSRAHPHNAQSKNEAQEHQSGGGDLPVTFSENEIAVAFVPFSSRLEVELAFHLVLRFTEF